MEAASFDAFLSHDWGKDGKNHERVRRVAAALTAEGLKPWFDEAEMRGDVNQRMAEGIEASRCMVVFLTRNYIDKANGKGPRGDDDNCKFEFDTGLLQQGVRRMLPVVMEPALRDTKAWRGQVGGKLGVKLYVDLSEEEEGKEEGAAFEAGVGRLIDEIRSAIACSGDGGGVGHGSSGHGSSSSSSSSSSSGSSGGGSSSKDTVKVAGGAAAAQAQAQEAAAPAPINRLFIGDLGDVLKDNWTGWLASFAVGGEAHIRDFTVSDLTLRAPAVKTIVSGTAYDLTVPLSCSFTFTLQRRASNLMMRGDYAACCEIELAEPVAAVVRAVTKDPPPGHTHRIALTAFPVGALKVGGIVLQGDPTASSSSSLLRDAALSFLRSLLERRLLNGRLEARMLSSEPVASALQEAMAPHVARVLSALLGEAGGVHGEPSCGDAGGGTRSSKRPKLR